MTVARQVHEYATDRFVPFHFLVEPGVITTGDGDLEASWQLLGVGVVTASPEFIRHIHDSYCQTVQSMALERIALWAHRIRRRLQSPLPLAADLAPEAPDARAYILAAHAKTIEAEGLYVHELYLTAVLKSALHPVKSIKPRLEPKHDLAARLARFREMTQSLERGLAAFTPCRLAEYERTHVKFSSQLRLYAFLLNGIDEAQPVPQGTIKSALSTSRLRFANARIVIEGATRTRFAAVLDLKQYPARTHSGVLDGVLDGAIDAIETQSFSPCTRLDAERYLLRQRNQLISAADASTSQIEELRAALDGVASGNFAIGEYHYSLALLADSTSELSARISATRARLADAGFQSAVIDLIPDLAWFAQLPGNWKHRPRQAYLSSRNFCALAPMHSEVAGKPTGNPWGAAVTVLKGPSSAPVWFNFHDTPRHSDASLEKAPANTLIIGQTGSGKTVLELFLLTSALKYSPRVMLFDKDRSAEIALRALGACYTVFEHGTPTQINPLQWDPHAKNLAFMVRWVESLLSDDVVLSASARSALERAIETLVGFPLKDRRLSVLLENIPVGESQLARGLRRWCRGSSLGWAFDTADDAIASNASLRGFDLTAFFESKQLMSPVMLALLHQMEAGLDGSRLIYVITEFWKALDHPLFADFVRNKQKTIRKQNGLGIFDTQSPHDLLKSPYAAAIIEQSATTIFLPNPLGHRDDYCGGLKCTPAEFDLIRGLAPGDRRFLVKQGGRSYLAALDLSGSPGALSLLSSNAESVRLLDSIRARVGDDFGNWWPPFEAAMANRQRLP